MASSLLTHQCPRTLSATRLRLTTTATLRTFSSPSPPRAAASVPINSCRRRPITMSSSNSAPRSNTVKVGAAQITSTNDLDANFNTCSRLAREAAVEGVKLLCFPESFSFVSAKNGDSLKIAEPLDGPLMQRYCSLARFDVDVPGNMVYKESDFTIAGNDVVAEDSPVGRLGLTVCYDLRFPELYQQLRFQHHSQVLLVPSAFTKVTGEAHWEILLRARAIETQCYIACQRELL